MQTPIHELLSRIRWDPQYATGEFELGYFDRRERIIQRVALAGVSFPADAHHAFLLRDETGRLRRIPLHRVREVYRNGQLIWQRPA